jgi:hypothetical protein
LAASEGPGPECITTVPDLESDTAELDAAETAVLDPKILFAELDRLCDAGLGGNVATEPGDFRLVLTEVSGALEAALLGAAAFEAAEVVVQFRQEAAKTDDPPSTVTVPLLKRFISNLAEGDGNVALMSTLPAETTRPICEALHRVAFAIEAFKSSSLCGVKSLILPSIVRATTRISESVLEFEGVLAADEVLGGAILGAENEVAVVGASERIEEKAPGFCLL